MVYTDLIEEHTRRGWQLIEIRKYDHAIKEFKEALSTDPNNASAHLGLGRAYLEKNNLKSARPEIETALKLNPMDAESYNILSHWHYQNAENKTGIFKSREYEKVLAAIKKAIEIEPNNVFFHTSFGHYLHCLKKYNEAEKELKTALSLDPNYNIAHINIHVLYYDMDNKEKSDHHLKEALRLSPNEAVAHHNLGYVYLSMGNHSKAIECARNALRLAPNLKESEALLLLANTLEAKGSNLIAMYLRFDHYYENTPFPEKILLDAIIGVIISTPGLIILFVGLSLGMDVGKYFKGVMYLSLFILVSAIIILDVFREKTLLFLIKRGWIK